MYKSVDLNSVAEHVKNIVQSSRCTVCDKHDGQRVRYVCGHTSCDECAELGNCSLCLTPPGVNSSKPVVDKPLTQRAENACRLLDSFQECFNFDVIKRKRLSEQLKVEKELFPQCIQAPSKYYNKRKSGNQSLKKNKENSPISLPGQEITRNNSMMENSNKNVHEWLNKYVKRKPFSELDSNQTIWRNEKQKTHSNSSVFTEVKAQKSYSGINKKRKIDSRASAKEPKISKNVKTKKINDESGIVLDYDDELEKEAAIVIDDDSQDVIDKDKEALLAVEKAEKNKIPSTQSIATTFFDSASQDNSKILLNEKKTPIVNKEFGDKANNVILSEKREVENKIPFYKKGYLTEICKYCIDTTNSHFKLLEDVSITIDSKNFITEISVSQVNNYLINKECIQINTDSTTNNIIAKKTAEAAIECNIHDTKESAANDIQDNTNTKKSATDVQSNTVTKKAAATSIENNIITEYVELNNVKSDINELKVKSLPLNQDLFRGFEKKDDSRKLVNKSGNVIIEESDTDSDIDLGASFSLEVTAEVHRSCDQMDYNILNQVANIEEHSKRARRAARGNTPNSTDSSDKENYNPNRMRRTNHSAKKKYKK